MRIGWDLLIFSGWKLVSYSGRGSARHRRLVWSQQAENSGLTRFYLAGADIQVDFPDPRTHEGQKFKNQLQILSLSDQLERLESPQGLTLVYIYAK